MQRREESTSTVTAAAGSSGMRRECLGPEGPWIVFWHGLLFERIRVRGRYNKAGNQHHTGRPCTRLPLFSAPQEVSAARFLSDRTAVPLSLWGNEGGWVGGW